MISGNGKFKINNDIYEVEAGDIVEIPPSTKFIVLGDMKVLLIMNSKIDKNAKIVG